MPKTIHDLIRAGLLKKAGVFEPIKAAPSLAEIERLQSCPQFEEYRKNRMIMGYFRHGSLQSQIGKSKYDNTGSITRRLDAYRADHNREHLVDIANLAMVEFATHPDYPFRPSDDGIHALKKSEKIVQRDLTSIGCRACVRTTIKNSHEYRRNIKLKPHKIGQNALPL